MITFQNVTRKYGELTAVDTVNFSIQKGEIVGLLGHNGAGKTTIMKMLTGYLEPTEGSITVDGLDIEANRLEAQTKIGYLPENSPVYPDMLVAQYLEHVCDLRGIEGARRTQRIKDVVRLTALQEKIDSQINTLSKGYRQRVGVAQAIIHEPEILILDEPTNGLDPNQIHEMRGLVTDLAKNATVILSTHILQEVQAVCSRVLIMSQGKLAKDAKLAELRESNRLVVSVDSDEAKLKNVLSGINGLAQMQYVGNGGSAKRFMIEADQSTDIIAPQVAEKIINSGLKLYALELEQRTLESIFSEASQGATHTIDAIVSEGGTNAK